MANPLAEHRKTSLGRTLVRLYIKASARLLSGEPRIRHLRKLRLMDFKDDYKAFAAINDGRFSVRWEDRHPCLDDDQDSTPFDRHYLYHTSWVARLLAEAKPDRHVDVGSCLRFVTIASAFVPVTFLDYRPPNLRLNGLDTKHGDITALPLADGSVASLSCMHVLEHIGLGRYGDPLDPQGDLKGAAELNRVLAPGGHFYFAVPVAGSPRIDYNAHRVYTVAQVLEMFDGLTLASYAMVPDTADQGDLVYGDEGLALSETQAYGCGCFHFTKPETNT